MEGSERPLAVVTGASSGIGLELARVFGANGFDLIVAAEDAELEEARRVLTMTGAAVAAPSKAQVQILGAACTTVALAAGTTRNRTINLKIKPAAAGRATPLKLSARGPQVEPRRAGAVLKVNGG